MFKNSYQNGLLSIFYSCGANPLAIWDMEVKNGHIKRLTDHEVNSLVLEIVSTNVATTYIRCPKNNQVLGITLPFLVMILKNLKRYFSFEITILDDRNMRRRFRISNFQSTTKIKPFCTSMPIGLSGGWNQIQFNLADFTRRAYGSQFLETLSVQVHANTRIRRIYFAERLYTEEELPQDYKLYLPLEKKQMKGKKAAKAEPPKAAKSLIAAPEPQVQEVVGDEIASKKSDIEAVMPVSEPEDAKKEVEEPSTPVEEPAMEGSFVKEGVETAAEVHAEAEEEPAAEGEIEEPQPEETPLVEPGVEEPPVEEADTPVEQTEA